MPESASVVARRVARRAAYVLMAMREGLHAGDDSGLVSVWDEICVQVQGQQSALCDAYDRTAYSVIYEEVQKAPPAPATTLWLETPASQQWVARQCQENGAEPAPYDADDVVLDVLGRAVRHGRRL